LTAQERQKSLKMHDTKMWHKRAGNDSLHAGTERGKRKRQIIFSKNKRSTKSAQKIRHNSF